jgi:hypothetical protein
MELEEDITLAQHLPGKTNDNCQSILHEAIQQPDRLELGNSLIQVWSSTSLFNAKV